MTMARAGMFFGEARRDIARRAPAKSGGVKATNFETLSPYPVFLFIVSDADEDVLGLELGVVKNVNRHFGRDYRRYPVAMNTNPFPIASSSHRHGHARVAFCLLQPTILPAFFCIAQRTSLPRSFDPYQPCQWQCRPVEKATMTGGNRRLCRRRCDDHHRPRRSC